MTLTTEGQFLLIGAIVGLIVGWFITWLIFRSRAKKTQASIQELDSKLADANSNLGQVKAQVQKLDNELKAAQADAAQAHAKVADQDAALFALQAERAAAAQKLSTGAADLDARQADLDALQADYNKLQQERDILSENLEATSVDLGHAKKDLAVSAKALADKEVALNEAYLRAVTLQRELMEHQSVLAATQSELGQLRRDVVGLTSLNQELESKMHNARGEVAGELALLTATMLRMKEESLNQANRQIASLQAEVDTMKAGKVALR